MKKIKSKLKKIENDRLIVISIMLFLPTWASILTKRPLAWILVLVYAVWLIFIGIVLIVKAKEK